MKTKNAVEFSKVTKKYYKGGRYQPTFREWFGAIFGGEKFQRPKFKALDSVSFSIKRGKVIGFLGSNGAGKSTVLKLISKITYPNSGRITVNGSVAGLLELGTGFHHELSGHENIYLYGAILGLSKNQVDDIYDEVVEFSGIRDFVDSPLKHYSSGMIARLGFSVAIHLKPDILLIDEVLAVGDLAFRDKCMNYMVEYCKDPDHTVVFISHDPENVKLICEEVIWLDHGKVVEIGKTSKVLKKYIAFQHERTD